MGRPPKNKESDLRSMLEAPLDSLPAEPSFDEQVKEILTIHKEPEKPIAKEINREGWKHYTDDVKKRVVILSEKPEGMGVAAYWRTGKRYNREIKRYEDVAYWADLMLSEEIKFEPKYYRER